MKILHLLPEKKKTMKSTENKNKNYGFNQNTHKLVHLHDIEKVITRWLKSERKFIEMMYR